MCLHNHNVLLKIKTFRSIILDLKRALWDVSWTRSINFEHIMFESLFSNLFKSKLRTYTVYHKRFC